MMALTQRSTRYRARPHVMRRTLGNACPVEYGYMGPGLIIPPQVQPPEGQGIPGRCALMAWVVAGMPGVSQMTEAQLLAWLGVHDNPPPVQPPPSAPPPPVAPPPVVAPPPPPVVDKPKPTPTPVTAPSYSSGSIGAPSGSTATAATPAPSTVDTAIAFLKDMPPWAWGLVGGLVAYKVFFAKGGRR